MASGFNSVFFGFISSLLIVQFRSVLSQQAPGCPPGWSQFGSRCFIFYNIPKTSLDAELFCISVGGNRASIHSAGENLFLNDLVKRVTGADSRTWVGAIDVGILPDRLWLWSDGSPFDYNRWSEGEPNNFGGSRERCIEINFGGPFWNDESCSTQNPFICAKKR
ncbi:ladderlectin-like [Odontesthes bonariensis]|uniref:ladderlectin-like n=1 Tax=Odontesthes bonariensis TaxID=219752 RepID=UPI003F58EC91